MQDAELLQMLCAEPEQGMQMLIRHYSGYVYAIVKNKLSSCGTHEDFEETVSDVFIRFYEWVRKAPETCGSIRAVLAAIAKRQAVSRFRALTKQPPCESYEELLSEQPDSAAAPDESVLLMQTVKALGEPESEIILRRYYFGQSSNEIAAALGLKPNTVDQKLSRSLKKLRAVWKEDAS